MSAVNLRHFTGIHSVATPIAVIENTGLMIVGGGNPQSLKESRERGLLATMMDVIKRPAGSLQRRNA
ncbi:hypothetical protein ABLE14_003883 [Salmonella enterica]|nr:hypothetical protein [Salmonella enterica]EII9336858.1 hypothetical protein [Salmonella enterica]EJI0186989.1 hypothetical protein [Salmonella enterica]HCM4742676.1 hypothetical protein [Salmonella enterica subsp. enterica serovar Panama]